MWGELQVKKVPGLSGLNAGNQWSPGRLSHLQERGQSVPRLVGLTQVGLGALGDQEGADLVSCCLQGQPPRSLWKGRCVEQLSQPQQTQCTLCVSLTSWHRPNRATMLLLMQHMYSVQVASVVAWVSPRSLLRQRNGGEQGVTLAAGCSCLCGLVLCSLCHLHSVQSME